MQEFALVEQFLARFCGNTSTRVWQNDENALQNAVCRKLRELFGKLQVKPCKPLQQNHTVVGKIARNKFISYYSIAKRAQFCTTCAPFANVCLQTASQQRLDKNKLCKISICQTQNSKARCAVKRNRNKRAQTPPRGGITQQMPRICCRGTCTSQSFC